MKPEKSGGGTSQKHGSVAVVTIAKKSTPCDVYSITSH